MVRRRDAVATRQKIIEAARVHFSLYGFDGAGLREIAKDAGINVALINRYFGSKEGLFEEAVALSLNVDVMLQGSRETFGVRIAEKIRAKKFEGDEENSNLSVIRSVGSAKVQSTLKDVLEQRAIKKIADWLGGSHPEQRAALIVSHLLGFDLLFRVVEIDALGLEHADKITDRFAKTLQSYVDDSF